MDDNLLRANSLRQFGLVDKFGLRDLVEGSELPPVDQFVAKLNGAQNPCRRACEMHDSEMLAPSRHCSRNQGRPAMWRCIRTGRAWRTPRHPSLTAILRGIKIAAIPSCLRTASGQPVGRALERRGGQ